MRKGLGALPYTRAIETRLISSLRTIPSHGLRRRAFTTASLPPNAEHIDTTSKSQADEAEDSPAMKRLEWVVNKHLQYLKDPKLIADHVRATLLKDKFLEALLLTRKASRNTKVTVAWNHLIDYQMKQQRLHASIKLYNEMKKRAQTPDALTYTIIFRGCAASMHPKVAVSEALRIYNSMINIGTIKPNTIHFNAVLEVCSRAGDIESLFTVVKTANDGLRNPNNQSYTIIMNALRYQAWDTKDMAPEDIRNNKKTAVARAQGIWEEVSDRWRKGRVTIDEELVCAMGRVLAEGDRVDNNSILDLLNQTMQIPNYSKTIQPVLPDPTEPTASQESVIVVDKPALLPPKPKAPVFSKSGSSVYAKPGNNTLSLILTCLKNTHKTSLAPKYWDYLVKQLGVVPDKENYLRYFKALSQGHASGKAAEAITTVPMNFLTPMLFRVAFTACIHDNLNRNAFQNAKVIFNDMITRMRIPDALSMRLFLNTARSNYVAFKETEGSDPEKNRLALGVQIVTALDMMWNPFRLVCNRFNFPEETTKSPQQEHELTKERKKEMLHTARRMVAAHDAVIHGSMIPKARLSQILMVRKNILLGTIQRFTAKMSKFDKEVEGKEERWAEKQARGEKGGEEGGVDERVEVEFEKVAKKSVYKTRRSSDRLREELGVRL